MWNSNSTPEKGLRGDFKLKSVKNPFTGIDIVSEGLVSKIVVIYVAFAQNIPPGEWGLPQREEVRSPGRNTKPFYEKRRDIVKLKELVEAMSPLPTSNTSP